VFNWGVCVFHSKLGLNSSWAECCASSSGESKLHSLIMGVVLADMDCLPVSSLDPDGVDQSVSRLYGIGLSLVSTAMEIAWDVNVIVDVPSSDAELAMFMLMLDCLERTASDRGFPARDDGLYLQSVPQVRHLEHIGLVLLHLTCVVVNIRLCIKIGSNL
jgi:hypothetical protein